MTEFPIENLPFGVFQRGAEAHIGVAFEDRILDLHACAGLIDEPSLLAPRLNELMSRGRAVARDVRGRVAELLTRGTADEHLLPRSGARMLLPMTKVSLVSYVIAAKFRASEPDERERMRESVAATFEKLAPGEVKERVGVILDRLR